jgi:hypothetical protein
MLEKNEIICRIMPDNTPMIIRHCSKCNKNMPFYCSEKFRINSNGAKVDIWLIYKCEKCDTTWKLTISKGVKPCDLPPGKFEKYINNAAALAWEYAFDRGFLKQQSCKINYAHINYSVEGSETINQEFPLLIHLKSTYTFDLKLSKFLTGVFNISTSQLKTLVSIGKITTTPECDIMKHKIRADIDILVQCLNFQ